MGLRSFRSFVHFWWQRTLCRLGRHDLEPVAVVGGWVHSDCFYCPYKKASKIPDGGS